jgi:nicotinate phosphoribosyltransferase
MFDYTATYTDQYQLTMAQAYFLKGRGKQRAVFDYFFRKLPFGGGYAVFTGLEDLLEVLQDLRFDKADLEFLAGQGFDPGFLKHLERFRFRGDVHSSREGDLIFPTRPVLQVEGNLIEAQMVETLLLNILNFQTLIATKASRMRRVAGDRRLVDFGLRRAHGPGGYYASRAAIVGGFDATSNVRAGRDYGAEISGTMAHSFIESCDDELTAFRDFAEVRPGNCVLLVDTYDTLVSGLPNAITVAKEMEERGHRLRGIRLDSGDLAWLARESRKMLDAAGLDYVKIAASNQLDEYVIRSLLEQKAPIDLYGVGTSLVTGQPDGALDGVYKLVFAGGSPRIKLSETVTKITIPHRKQVYRMMNDSGGWIGADVVAMADEGDFKTMHHPFDNRKFMSVEKCGREPLLETVMEGGKRLAEPRSLADIAAWARERLDLLPAEFKRFENPHIYKVGLSDGLKMERNGLIEEHRRE